jgi:hypothetical protein
MTPDRKINLSPLGIDGSYSLNKLNKIPQTKLPVYRERDRSIMIGSTRRAHLFFEKLVNHGSYGNLVSASRITEGSIKPVMVKIPRLPEMDLTQEAIIQSLCFTHLKHEGACWAIPQVYDIFLKDDKPCFSMEQIKGKTVLEWFESSKTPDRDFLLLMAQLSLLLLSLETGLNLDHRDLKADNILIRDGPVLLTVSTWTLECPFQVILLDFGFACMGSLVDLGGVLPPMDPCPKEGRDLFQLLVSLISLKSFSSTISHQTKEKITQWLSIGSKSYGSLAESWSPERWIYLLTSQDTFKAPKCSPLELLDNISKEIPKQLSRT